MNSTNRAFIVGLISQATQILSRLLLIPFFITIFGVQEYGTWVYLNSIAIFLSVTDFGINSASLNKLFRLRDNANSFHNHYCKVLTFFFLLSIVLCLISIILTYAINLFTPIENYYALLTLLLFYSSQYFCNYIINYLQAIGRQATDGIYNIFISISQILFLILSGYIWKSFLICSIFYIIPYFLVTLFVFNRYLRRNFYFSFNFCIEIRSLFIEASGFSKAQFTQYLSNNGPIFLIKYFISLESVAIFSVCRTVTNLVLRLMTTYPLSAWPTLSYTYAGDKNYNVSKGIITNSIKISLFWIISTILFFTFFKQVLFGDILKLSDTPFDLVYLLLFHSIIFGYNSIYLIFLSAVGRVNTIYNIYIFIILLAGLTIFLFSVNITLNKIIVILIIFEGFIFNYFIIKEFNKSNIYSISYLQNLVCILIILFILILININLVI